jgi:hypothetical protein
MLSESCGGRSIGQAILREILDAIEADPIDRAHELLRGSEKLLVADGKAPTEEIGYYLVKRKSWARILL